MQEYIAIIEDIVLCGISNEVTETRYNEEWKNTIYEPSNYAIKKDVWTPINMWWNPGLTVSLFILPCGPICSIYNMILLIPGIAYTYINYPYLEYEFDIWQGDAKREEPPAAAEEPSEEPSDVINPDDIFVEEEPAPDAG